VADAPQASIGLRAPRVTEIQQTIVTAVPDIPANAVTGTPPGGNVFPQPKTPDELWDLLQDPQSSAHGARHLGEALVRSGVLSTDDLRSALASQVEERKLGIYRQLGQQLVERGKLTEAQLRHVIAGWLGNRVLDPRHYLFDQEALALVPREVAEREAVLPLLLHEDLLVVAMADPLDHRLLDELRFMTQRRLVVVMAAPGTLAPAIARAYEPVPVDPKPDRLRGGGRAAAKDLAADLQTALDVGSEPEADVVSESDNTLVRLINTLIEEAIAQKASDIHIETHPTRRKVRIRFRKDGRLMPYMELPHTYRAAVVARIKVMCELDISERRKPQDGKIDFSRYSPSHHLELRVATIPTVNGAEDVVMRLLSSAKPLKLSELNLTPSNEQALAEVVERPYGMVLVTGPTGSGKTVSLYTCLNVINKPGINISTAEDPAEINLPGVNQVNVNDKAGLTFAAALKSFLRQDPDVIMVGEIRDLETADIAIKAAQTGHMVFSTLHTNDAPSTLTRLMNMGVLPFNIASSVILITAQRLARRLCTCKRPTEILDEVLLQAGFKEEDLDGSWKPYEPVGCERCSGSGYKGRVGIYQLMPISNSIERIILASGSAMEIEEQAQRDGVRNLRQSGLMKVKQGLTSLEEVLGCTNE